MADLQHMTSHFQDSINLHRELCLEFARRQKNVFYPSAKSLAVDYGRHGTTRFFPLSQLIYQIEHDTRFIGHVRSKDYVQ